MDLLRSGLQTLGLALSAEQAEHFQSYLDLLMEWNQRFNLTAIRSPQGIQMRHFLDSLTCVLVTGDLQEQSLIDIGSGAGFPGIPLKIIYPGLTLTIVESVGKKATFLLEVVDRLSLADVHVITARAEDLGHDPDHRERYDWAVARAVAPLPVLLEYLLPFCRLGGTTLAQKGLQVDRELNQAANAIELLGGGPPLLTPVILPQQEEGAALVSVPKIRVTPLEYPRRAGLPSKRPL